MRVLTSLSGLLACVSVSSAVPRRLPPLHNTESFRLKDNIRPYIDRGRKNTAIERSSAGLYERPYGHRPASLEVNGDGSIILNEDGSLKMHERRRSARKVFEERNDNEATSTEDEESSATTSSKEDKGDTSNEEADTFGETSILESTRSSNPGSYIDPTPLPPQSHPSLPPLPLKLPRGRKNDDQLVDVNSMSSYQCVRDCIRWNADKYDVASKTKYQLCHQWDNPGFLNFCSQTLGKCVVRECKTKGNSKLRDAIQQESWRWFEDFCEYPPYR